MSKTILRLVLVAVAGFFILQHFKVIGIALSVMTTIKVAMLFWDDAEWSEILCCAFSPKLTKVTDFICQVFGWEKPMTTLDNCCQKIALQAAPVCGLGQLTENGVFSYKTMGTKILQRIDTLTLAQRLIIGIALDLLLIPILFLYTGSFGTVLFGIIGALIWEIF